MNGNRITTQQDIEDFICGCLFIATGGGGSASLGEGMLKKALSDGLDIAWDDVESVEDAALTAAAFGMGSIAPRSAATQAKIAALGLQEKSWIDAMADAVVELERYLDRPVSHLVAAELGAGNSAAALVTAARLGRRAVDGDYAGRSIPDEMQTTRYLHGIQSWPFVSVDGWGNVCIVKNVATPEMLERVGKMLAVAAFGVTTMAAAPLDGATLKQVLVRGTLTKALQVGRVIRGAAALGDDPVAAALAVVGGWRLFEGVVEAKEWRDEDGYMFGTTSIAGTGAWSGSRLKVWFKNENLVSWLDDRPFVCCPDLLTLVDAETARGTVNSEISEGMRLVAVGMRGVEGFRTPHMLQAAAGPRYFGFDFDYVPIENLVRGAAATH